MEAGSLTIGVAGATGAVGGEVVRQLAAARFPIRALVPMASPTCETHAIEFRGQSVVVRNLDDPSLEGCDVVLLAVPRPVAAGVIPELLERGIAVIDLTGVLADAGAPTVVAGVNPTELEAFTERRAVACPSPLVTAISSIMAPLCWELGEVRCRGLAMHPASSGGRAGIEEFTSQVVALFSQKQAPADIFSHGLAFDVVPRRGDADDDGWSEFELQVARQTSMVLGIDPSDVVLSSIIAPWYNSLCLSLHFAAGRVLSREWVRQRLGALQGVSWSGEQLSDLPRPRNVDDGTLHVGRLRMDPAGEGFHLWAVADELRFGLAGNAVRILHSLVEDGWL